MAKWDLASDQLGLVKDLISAVNSDESSASDVMPYISNARTMKLQLASKLFDKCIRKQMREFVVKAQWDLSAALLLDTPDAHASLASATLGHSH
jgi:hypothetical protein